MHIVATHVEKAVLLKVSGRMDADNADEFDKACETWIAKGAKHLDCRLGRPPIRQQYGAALLPGRRAKAEIDLRLLDPLWTPWSSPASI